MVRVCPRGDEKGLTGRELLHEVLLEASLEEPEKLLSTIGAAFTDADPRRDSNLFRGLAASVGRQEVDVSDGSLFRLLLVGRHGTLSFVC